MTVGTGFFGRSSLTENLQPQHLVQWTRLAYATDPTSRSATSPAWSRGRCGPEPAPVAASRRAARRRAAIYPRRPARG